MSAPRHLWSGDWRRESEAAADELARRRASRVPRRPAEPEPPRPPRPPKRRLLARLAAYRPARRTVRLAGLIAVVVLLGAGAAYGVASVLGGSGSAQPTRPAATRAWLGADLTGTPVGGVAVAHVVMGGPAYRAGLRSGDVIVEVAGQRVDSTADVDSALAPLGPGARTNIVFDRGPGTYTTQATLEKRPRNSP